MLWSLLPLTMLCHVTFLLKILNRVDTDALLVVQDILYYMSLVLTWCFLYFTSFYILFLAVTFTRFRFALFERECIKVESELKCSRNNKQCKTAYLGVVKVAMDWSIFTYTSTSVCGTINDGFSFFFHFILKTGFIWMILLSCELEDSIFKMLGNLQNQECNVSVIFVKTSFKIC